MDDHAEKIKKQTKVALESRMNDDAARELAEKIKKQMEAAKASLKAKPSPAMDAAAAKQLAEKIRQQTAAAKAALTSSSLSSSSEKAKATSSNKRKLEDDSGTNAKKTKTGKVIVESGVVNPYLAHERGELSVDGVLDDRLGQAMKDKNRIGRKGLKFVREGKYAEQAAVDRAVKVHREFVRNRDDERVKEKLRNVLEDISQVMGKSSSSSSSQRNTLGNAQKSVIPNILLNQGAVPEMDWWDEPFLGKEDSGIKDFQNLAIGNVKTYKLIEHPATVERLVPEKEVREIPLYLTKEERRRKRRQFRRERAQEVHDKIAAGLIPPPPPKVKLSNLMRVLKDEAVLDPSMIEKKVREQVQQRHETHMAINEARKLTPQEKWDKIQKKAELDTKGAPEAAVYRVENISSPAGLAASNRYKMDANAKKLCLTGCVLIVPVPVENESGEKKHCNLVIVEGGEKRLRKFEHQMLKRIKWPNANGDVQTDPPCVVKVWQGSIAKMAFPKRFTIHETENGEQAQKFLESLNIQHYWDLALQI